MLRKFSFCALFVLSSIIYSQEKVVYKEINGLSLVMEVYTPENLNVSKKHPAMLFYFGGGWNKGSIKQFEEHAKYYSKKGIVCFLVDYRVKNRHQSTPFESLKDAKSSIRYVRKNAELYHIDTQKIIAVGASAGGQLAAAAALIEEYNEVSDDISISCKPDALVLFNPAIDNGPGGVGFGKFGDLYKTISPIHNITKEAPPTIMFLGTNDNLIPVETAKYYQVVMKKLERICELHLYEGMKHGFFNVQYAENYKSTIAKTDDFLQSIHFSDSNFQDDNQD